MSPPQPHLVVVGGGCVAALRDGVCALSAVALARPAVGAVR